eukprot:g1553.t1
MDATDAGLGSGGAPYVVKEAEDASGTSRATAGSETPPAATYGRYDDPRGRELYRPLDTEELFRLTTRTDRFYLNSFVPCYGPNRIGEPARLRARAWRISANYVLFLLPQFGPIYVWMHSCFQGNMLLVLGAFVPTLFLDSISSSIFYWAPSNPLLARALREEIFLSITKTDATSEVLGIVIVFAFVFIPWNIVYCVPHVLGTVPVPLRHIGSPSNITHANFSTPRGDVDQPPALGDLWVVISSWIGVVGFLPMLLLCHQFKYAFLLGKFISKQSAQFVKQYADDVVELLQSPDEDDDGTIEVGMVKKTRVEVLNELQQKQAAMFTYWRFYCDWLGVASLLSPINLIVWTVVSAFMIAWDPSNVPSVVMGLLLSFMCVIFMIQVGSSNSAITAARAHASIKKRLVGARDYDRALRKFHGSVVNLNDWLERGSTTLRLCGLQFDDKLLRQFITLGASIACAAVVRLLLKDVL